jgi:hypothetical protein
MAMPTHHSTAKLRSLASEMKVVLTQDAKPEDPKNDVELLDPKPHHCRWPINDCMPYKFCAADKAKGSSYCAVHLQVSRGRQPKYRPLPVREAA